MLCLQNYIKFGGLTMSVYYMYTYTLFDICVLSNMYTSYSDIYVSWISYMVLNHLALVSINIYSLNILTI